MVNRENQNEKVIPNIIQENKNYVLLKWEQNTPFKRLSKESQRRLGGHSICIQMHQ